MKITNIGEKIVGIGATILMPGDEGIFNESVAEAPSIKNLVSLGYLKVEEEPKAAPARKAPAKVEKTSEDEPEATALETKEEKTEASATTKTSAKRTRTRKSSAE